MRLTDRLEHEQQMRVGVVHAMGNALAIGLYGASLALPGSRRGRWLRLCGLASLSGLACSAVTWPSGWPAARTMLRKFPTWSSGLALPDEVR